MSTSPDLPDLPDPCWPVDTSCVEDWSSQDYTDDDRARAVVLAGQSMRLLTGGRVGGCPVTVRPSVSRCRPRTWADSGLAWAPVQIGGQWLNLGTGDALPAWEVWLPGAQAVTAVRVDGVTLDPASYRLDPGGRLVRVGGAPWPTVQDVTIPDTAPGTWSVSYLVGVPVDGLGAVMAGRLAGEFVRACSGGRCGLPANVQQVARAGITLSLEVGVFPGGKTGLRDVDAYLARWNPHGLTAPPLVWSPDQPSHRHVRS